MQVSVQTDRKKKPQLTPIAIVGGLSEVQEEDEKQKQRKIKKLSLINRQLIETLKRQNEELTKKINKQKMKIGKSIDRVQSPDKNIEREKKQLANAYKQIEMYKNVLKDLRSKEISTESIDKLNQLQNKIKYQDSTIDQLQKELKYVKNIKQQQEKELHLYQNQDVKKSVNQLEEQLKQLKDKLKQAKKQTKKREQMSLKQHTYFLELQKTLRKHNDQYYPGAGNKTKRDNSMADGQQITERQWQILKAQLTQLKKNHEQNNKKIELLTRMRNKEIKSCEDNQARLKEKQRKLQTIKTKLNQLAKLVGSENEEKNVKKVTNVSQQANNQENNKFEVVMQNGKKVYKTKNPEDEREVKRWMIPAGYMQQFGKVLPDSVFFSDKAELRTAKKSKITKVQVWIDSNQCPAAFQCSYQTEQNRIISGLTPFSLTELQEMEDKVIEYKKGDYLAKITGKFNEGFLNSLILISKFGRKEQFNPKGMGEQFRLQPRPNEIPTCVFGAATRDMRGSIKLCYIGCQFISDW